MARYRKIDPRIWNDAKFRTLSDNGKLAFLFLLTHPHMTPLGAMRATMDGLAAELGWTVKAFQKAFAEAFRKAMVKHDPDACFIGLPNFLKYNSPESPNVVKSWAASLDLIPECNLKVELLQEVKGFAEALSKAFGEALPEGFRKALLNQEQEQEQEQEPEQKQEKKTTKARTAPVIIYSEEFLNDIWAVYPKRHIHDNKKMANQKYQAAIKAGATHEHLALATKNYAQAMRNNKNTGTEFVMQARRFFGPAEEWRPYLEGVPEGKKLKSDYANVNEQNFETDDPDILRMMK